MDWLLLAVSTVLLGAVAHAWHHDRRTDDAPASGADR